MRCLTVPLLSPGAVCGKQRKDERKGKRRPRKNIPRHDLKVAGLADNFNNRFVGNETSLESEVQ